MRVAIYARIDDHNGVHGPAAQLTELRQFAAGAGWEIVGEYVDRNRQDSGDRSELRKLLQCCESRSIECVLFWSLDSFCRGGAAEVVRQLSRLIDAGVRFRSLTEPVLDTVGERAEHIAAIVSVLARRERLLISRRNRESIQRAKKSGVKIGRPRLSLDRQRILDLRAQGISLREIARRMGAGDGTVRRALKDLKRASEARQKR